MIESTVASTDHCLHRPEANAAWALCGRVVSEGKGELVAVHDDRRTWTYAELWERAGGATRMLDQFDVRPENRVVIVLPDSIAAAAATLGTLASGSVAVLLGGRLSESEYLSMIDDARPALVILDEAHSDLREKIDGGAHRTRTVVINDFEAFEAFDGEGGGPVIAPVNPDEPALIQYTSGSTGAPKGVVHLHDGLLRAPEGFGQRLGLTPDDRCFSTAKLSYGFGFGNSVLFPFSAHASSVLHRGNMDPRTAIAVTRKFAPTVFFAVPTLYAAILDNGSDLETAFSSVRLCVSAGEKLSEALAAEWMQRTDTPILDGLGCTESLHIFVSGDAAGTEPGYTGTPIPGAEVKLVDDDGALVEQGQLGNVLVKSPWNAARYWNRETLTRETMEGLWVRTGDVMSQDAEGRYVHFGRSDDVMKIRGLKVAATEVEAALVSHPQVAEAGVIQRIDARGIASVVGYVRAHGSTDEISEQDLRSHVRERLASHKVPANVIFLDELPHTSTGKLARHMLRSELGQNDLPDKSGLTHA